MERPCDPTTKYGTFVKSRIFVRAIPGPEKKKDKKTTKEDKPPTGGARK